MVICFIVDLSNFLSSYLMNHLTLFDIILRLKEAFALEINGHQIVGNTVLFQISFEKRGMICHSKTKQDLIIAYMYLFLVNFPCPANLDNMTLHVYIFPVGTHKRTSG